MSDEREVDEFSDFETYDIKAAEERAKHGGMIAPGRYHATLNGAKRTESKQKQTPGWELTFLIQGGPFSGSQITDTIYITDNEKSKDRLAHFGKRLGLLEKKPDGTGLVKCKGKTDFTDCLDVECVVEVIHEPDQKDPNKKWARLAMFGIWKKDDPEAMKGGATKAAAATPTQSNGTGKTPEGTTPPAKKKVGRENL